MAENYYGTVPAENLIEIDEADVEILQPGEARKVAKKPRKYNSTERIEAKKRFSSPWRMAQAINQYFDDCAECEILTDAEGNPVLYKGEPVYKKKPTPPTTTGLALALGFANRQSLVDFVKKDTLAQQNDMRSTSGEDYTLVYDTTEFRDIIYTAYTICEKFMEEKLYDKDSANGAKFALANCDKRWSDKQGLDLTLKTSEDHISADEAQKRLQALGFIQIAVKKDKDEKKDEKGEKNA